LTRRKAAADGRFGRSCPSLFAAAKGRDFAAWLAILCVFAMIEEDLRARTTATIDIHRAKNGTPGIHGLQGDELRFLRALRREHPHADFVFLSERKAPLSIAEAHRTAWRGR
jgi:hypothetical protein